MKFVKIVFFLAVLSLGLGLVTYGYLGGFGSVEVSEADFSSKEVIFVTHKGPYENLSQSWSDFQKKWEKAGLKDCDSLAVYLDAPDTAPEKLRSILACNVSHLEQSQKESLKTAFSSFVLPGSKALTSSFPFKNEFSYFLGPMKVYPEMQRVLTDKKIKPTVAIETYGDAKNNSKIGYVMPIEGSIQDYQKLYDAFR